MKHQPTICIIDMAHMVVAHGNRRKKNMFHPHDGMIAEPTQENIENASKRNFSISFPFLLSQNSQATEENTNNEEIHPVTGSKMRLCLFDRFHETNTKQREEILRRITFVKELNGLINSQRDEQLHSSCRYDSRFFNNMKAVNHIFLFRSIIDSRNEKINEEKVSRIEALSHQKPCKDFLGRIILSKHEEALRSNEDKKRTYSSSFGLISEKNATPSKIIVANSSFNFNNVEAGEIQVKKSKNTKESTNDVNVASQIDDPKINTRCWNNQLNLTEIEKETLMSSNSWIDDNIINAVMTLLRRVSKNLNGLQDVIVAQKEGFRHDPNVEPFVQILHINNNHWITISNVFSKSYEFEVTPGYRVRPSINAYVYDSFHEISRKCGNIEYSFNVPKSVCELTKPIGAIEIMVADVQQQNGTNDCGVFAAAFAACLCVNIDPCTLTLIKLL